MKFAVVAAVGLVTLALPPVKAEPVPERATGVWSLGNAGSFDGSPDGIRHEGKAWTGWLGMDVRAGGWVAGVALRRGETGSDYRAEMAGGESGKGRFETSFTSGDPYRRWTFDEGFKLRGVVGAETGRAWHTPKEEGTADEKGDLTMWMESVGIRQAPPPSAGVVLAAQDSVSVVRVETEDGEETVTEPPSGSIASCGPAGCLLGQDCFNDRCVPCRDLPQGHQSRTAENCDPPEGEFDPPEGEINPPASEINPPASEIDPPRAYVIAVGRDCGDGGFFHFIKRVFGFTKVRCVKEILDRREPVHFLVFEFPGGIYSYMCATNGREIRHEKSPEKLESSEILRLGNICSKISSSLTIERYG